MHTMFDTFIVIWVIVSVLAVILESVHSIHYLLSLEFLILDAIAVSVFTIEYCLRLYCCVEEPGYKKAVSGRLKLAKSPSAIIDLLAIAPFFLEVFLHHLFDLRFMRVFRLLRLLKLTRYTGATTSLSKVIVREWPVMAASALVARFTSAARSDAILLSAALARLVSSAIAYWMAASAALARAISAWSP